MADIQLHSFPDADLPVDGADFLYISQSSEEKRVAITDLQSNFEKIDIYGLVEETLVNGDFFPFVDVSVGLTSAANRKLSGTNLKNYIQEKQHFTTQASVAEADTIVKRVDASAALTEITVANLRDDMLNFSQLDAETAAVSGDHFSFYDISVTEPKRITTNNLRLTILDPANINEMLDPVAGDYFLIYDTSEGAANKLSFTTLVSALNDSLGLDTNQYVTKTTTQTISGAKTFSAQPIMSAGVKVDTIVENTLNSGVTIDTVLLKDNTVTAINFYGILKPSASYDSQMRVVNGAVNIFTTIPNGYTNTQTATSGDFLEVYGVNADAQAKGGIIPAADGQYVLGTKNKQFEAVYAENGFFSSGIATQGTNYLSTVYVNNRLLTDGSGVVNPTSLPTATTSAQGAIEVADAAETRLTASLNALTPFSIASARYSMTSQGTAVNTSGASIAGTSLWTGAIKFGGLIINYGYIYFTTYNTQNTTFRIDYSDNDMYDFNSSSSYVVNLSNQIKSDTVSNDADFAASASTSNNTRLDIHVGRHGGTSFSTQAIYFLVIGN